MLLFFLNFSKTYAYVRVQANSCNSCLAECASIFPSCDSGNISYACIGPEPGNPTATCECTCTDPLIECLGNGDCNITDPSEPYCEQVDGQQICVECRNSGDCSSNEICRYNECVPRNSNECTPGNNSTCDYECPNRGGYCNADGNCDCYLQCEPPNTYGCPACPNGQNATCSYTGACGCIANSTCTPSACVYQECDGAAEYTYCYDSGSGQCPLTPSQGFCEGNCVCAYGATGTPNPGGSGNFPAIPTTNIPTTFNVPVVVSYDGPLITVEGLLVGLQGVLSALGLVLYAIPTLVSNFYKIMTSQGDPSALNDGKEGLWSGLVGSLFIVGGFTIFLALLRVFFPNIL